MRAEDDGGAIGNLIQLFDKDGAFCYQVIDHVTVVHDFMAYVDGRRKYFQRAFHDIDSAVDAGAEAAWISKVDVHEISLTCLSDFSMRVIDAEYLDTENDLLTCQRMIEVDLRSIFFHAYHGAGNVVTIG